MFEPLSVLFIGLDAFVDKIRGSTSLAFCFLLLLVSHVAYCLLNFWVTACAVLKVDAIIFCKKYGEFCGESLKKNAVKCGEIFIFTAFTAITAFLTKIHRISYTNLPKNLDPGVVYAGAPICRLRSVYRLGLDDCVGIHELMTVDSNLLYRVLP